MRKSEIIIEVNVDENHVPETLTWSAKDGGVEKEETKAAIMYFWDEEKGEAMHLDLWTKEMPMDHMKVMFHQMFATMATTYERATGEDDVAQKIRAFAEEYAFAAKIK